MPSFVFPLPHCGQSSDNADLYLSNRREIQDNFGGNFSRGPTRKKINRTNAAEHRPIAGELVSTHFGY